MEEECTRTDKMRPETGASRGAQCFRCPFCTYDDEFEDFQKVAELKNLGLVIYRHITRDITDNEDSNEAKYMLQGITPDPRYKDRIGALPRMADDKISDDVASTNCAIILQNIKNVEIQSADFLTEFEKCKASCPRCQYLMNNTQLLLESVALVEKNDVKGVCDTCRIDKKSGCPCSFCENLVNKFKTSKNKDLKHFQLLEKASVVEVKPSFMERRAYSEINIRHFFQKSEKSTERVPAVNPLFDESEFKRPKTAPLSDSAKEVISEPTIQKVISQKVIFQISKTHIIPEKVLSDFISQIELHDGQVEKNEQSEDTRIRAVIQVDRMKKIKEEPFKSGILTPYHRGDTKPTYESAVPLRKFHSDESLISSFSGLNLKAMKKQFQYFFPRITKKEIVKMKSSSEIIKDLQEKYLAAAEDKKKMQEAIIKREIEIEQRNKVAREEKMKLAEEEEKRKAYEAKQYEEELERNRKKPEPYEIFDDETKHERFKHVGQDDSLYKDKKGDKAGKQKVKKIGKEKEEQLDRIGKKKVEKVEKKREVKVAKERVTKPVKEKKIDKSQKKEPKGREKHEKQSRDRQLPKSKDEKRPEKAKEQAIKSKDVKEKYQAETRPKQEKIKDQAVAQPKAQEVAKSKGTKGEDAKSKDGDKKKLEAPRPIDKQGKDQEVQAVALPKDRDKKEQEAAKPKDKQEKDQVVVPPKDRDKKEQEAAKPKEKQEKDQVVAPPKDKQEKDQVVAPPKDKQEKEQAVAQPKDKQEKDQAVARPKDEDKKIQEAATSKDKQEKDQVVVPPKDGDKKEQEAARSKDKHEKDEAVAQPKDKQEKEQAVAQPKDKQEKEQVVAQPKDKQEKEQAVAQPKDKQEKDEPVAQPKVKQEKDEVVAQPKDGDKKEQEAARIKDKQEKDQVVARPKDEDKKEQEQQTEIIPIEEKSKEQDTRKEVGKDAKKVAEDNKTIKSDKPKKEKKATEDIQKSKVDKSKKDTELVPLEKKPIKKGGIDGENVLNKALAVKEKEEKGALEKSKKEEELLKKNKDLLEMKTQNLGAESMKKGIEKTFTKKILSAPEAVEKAETKKPAVQVDMKNIQIKRSEDDLILKMIKTRREGKVDTKPSSIPQLPPVPEKFAERIRKRKAQVLISPSDLELDNESLLRKKMHPQKPIIIGEKIFKRNRSIRFSPSKESKPALFKTAFIPVEEEKDIEEIILEPEPAEKPDEIPKGVIRYTLSDRAFIEKGWTILPTEKIVRKMNVYRMRPAHPEFDWFAHNKHKGLMQYDTGEKLAQFDDNGRGRWYYRNGRVALDYYDSEETNSQQRFVIYSSGEPDERGRSRPVTVLAMFDYLGNGVVFDHSGKIRLKYNQTEGVLLDREIGPVSHWKWHSLNDPPVLQQVMIDTHMPYKDPEILKLGQSDPSEIKQRIEDVDMLTIEFNNFVKEKQNKLKLQTFQPFQIKMKALKINEEFSLRVMNQASVYLLFGNGSTRLKLNLGMILDQQEIMDTETADLGEVSNTLERLPAETDSLQELQRNLENTRRFERVRTERNRRLRPPKINASVDALTAALSRPLRVGTVACDVPEPASCTDQYKGRKPPENTLYYDTRII